HPVAGDKGCLAKPRRAVPLACLLHFRRAGSQKHDEEDADCPTRKRSHDVVSASSAWTRARSAGSTSASKKGLRRIQPVTRQLGCGSGKTRGAYSRKAATVSLSVFLRAGPR